MLAGAHGDGSVTLFCPAKINLMLAVHGRREDGFHALTTVMAPLGFGDRLEVALADAGADVLACEAAGVPSGPDNLVLRAAEAFRGAAGVSVRFRFTLEKRIPAAAGLGGGSSDAAAALLAMNRLCGGPQDRAGLERVAASLGSDCPFFLDPRPCVLRGRGEEREALPQAAADRLAGQPVCVFKPDFGVSAGEAYGLFAKGGEPVAEAECEARLERFFGGGEPGALLANSLEAPVGRKYLGIAALLERLRRTGAACLMSGSGSACFLLPDPGDRDGPARAGAVVRESWGPSAFWVESAISGGDTVKLEGCADR